MLAEVADRHLRRFVVQVESADGEKLLGSGVLVAPGIALTCAHVVAGRAEVRLIPDRRASIAPEETPPESLSATVKAQSSARSGDQSAFWPFPDLAVLSWADWSDHVVAPLSSAEPRRTTEPHAWGFATREHGVRAVGSPSSFRYVGEDGDGFLSLKAGEAPPGLSGAPLVCPTLRRVVGLMSVTRDPDDARGGWAAPVSALESSVLSGELAVGGPELLRTNARNAWQGREEWAKALPIPDADDYVDWPWYGDALEPGAGLPSIMLRPEFRVVPYMFRADQIQGFLDWCRARAPFAISYLDAAGGSGKSRFAIEAASAIRELGWLSGMLPSVDRGADTVRLPRLLIVDYAEERDPDQLGERLAVLARSASEVEPVRILLLSRPQRGPGAGVAVIRELASGSALVALEAATDQASATAGLTLDQRAELFAVAYKRFGRSWYGPTWDDSNVPSSNLTSEGYGRPLDVLLEAYDAALTGPGWVAGQRPGLERALAHEARYWRIPGDVDPNVVKWAVALATLAGARSPDEVSALVRLVPGVSEESAATLDTAMARLYPGPDRWNALQPDRLGEALIADVLEALEDGGLDTLVDVLGLESDVQVERSLDVLARMAGGTETAHVAATALVARHGDLVARATRQLRSSDEHSGRSTLLDALIRAHVAILTEHRVARMTPNAQADLSSSSDELGELAVSQGRSAQAELIFRGALAIDERLSELEPEDTTFRRYLSVSYSKLGDLAVAAGRSPDAERLYQQSRELTEQLIELEPGNTTYRRDLSVSYNKLGDLAVAAGRSPDAERLYQQSLQVRQQLTDLEPGNTTYRRDLGVSYDKLGDLAVAGGRSPDAERLYQLSLQVSQELADLEPGNTSYRRDLSVSYNKLGDLAVAAGRSSDAERLYQQSLQVRQQLTELEPGNTSYRRDLSISYDKLGDLAVAGGRSPDAERLYQQSLQVRQQLTDLEPRNTTCRRDLSISYNKLGDLAVAAGRSPDAEQLFQQSLELTEQLIAREADNTTYRRDLSVCHERLGDLSLDAGEVVSAAEHVERALSLRRELASADHSSELYAAEYAYTLYLASRIREADSPGRVPIERRQVVDLLQPFEDTGQLSSRGRALMEWGRDSKA